MRKLDVFLVTVYPNISMKVRVSSQNTFSKVSLYSRVLVRTQSAYIHNPVRERTVTTSKARKYSRNNYYDVFQISPSAEKYKKRFPPKPENSFFSELETSEQTNLSLEKFLKQVFGGKKSHIATKLKERPFRLKTHFLRTEIFNKIRWVPFERIQTFSKKCRILSKKPKGRFPLVSHLLLEA